MIDRDLLLRPPQDIDQLFCLEDSFTNRAVALIQRLLASRRLRIDSVTFSFSLAGGSAGSGGISAEAGLIAPGRFEILAGRNFSSALHNFATWTAKQLQLKLPTSSATALDSTLLYDYWMWQTLHHELAHVTCGHLDYLERHGLIRYREIDATNSSRITDLPEGMDPRDVWWALECEADSYGTAFGLISLPLLSDKFRTLCATADDSIRLHGTLVSLYFYFFGALATLGKDGRHPAPAFRKAVCQPSLGGICKQLGLNYSDATLAMVLSDFSSAEALLGEKIDVRPYAEALRWMLDLDELLAKMQMQAFRKQ
jgi:hypothetical protein